MITIAKRSPLEDKPATEKSPSKKPAIAKPSIEKSSIEEPEKQRLHLKETPLEREVLKLVGQHFRLKRVIATFEQAVKEALSDEVAG